ncbi:MAG: hypothetical protein JWQ88_2984 [Rhodoferax sp.]|nr:hypothetical protein [Rhodoferax sp.]
MGTFSARSWRPGEEHRRERLLIFVTEEDRSAYADANIDRPCVMLDPNQKRDLIRTRRLELELVLVLRNPLTGAFEEIT